MNIFLNRLFVSVVGLSVFIAGELHALAIDDFFPGQRVIYTATNPDTTYRLTLSSLKKINGEWQAEKESLVRGGLNRVTLEIAAPYKFKTAALAVQQQFAGLGANLIYACEGMACGSSNAWANERFDVKQLYGLDLSQHYQVWSLQTEGKTQLAVVYLVQRGNKRIYSQLDLISPQQDMAFAPSEEVIAKQFYRDNQIALGGLSFEQGNIQIDSEYLRPYARAFNQKAFHKLHIVGHDYHSGSEEEQNQRSLAHAEAVKAVLIKLGVQAKRMEVKGIGALAPVAARPGVVAKEVQGRVVVLLK